MRCSLWVIVGVLVAGLSWSLFASGEAGTWEIVRQQEFPLTGVQGTPYSVSPDGEFLLTWSSDAGICLYSTEDLSPVGFFKPEVETDFPVWLVFSSIAWAPDGSYVIFTTADTRSWRIKLPSGELGFFPTSTLGKYFAFSPDGKRLAVGGGRAIVVAPPGALAEAPVAYYEGVLKGLVWCEAGLYYGVLAPDRETFQIWEADPSGRSGPELVWTCPYPYPGFNLKHVSSDGRFAWVGFDVVDLAAGDFFSVREQGTLRSLVFSQDGNWWLYSYDTVVRDGGIRKVYRLSIRPAGTPEDEEQVLFESEKLIGILGWAPSGRAALLLVHSEGSELLFLDLNLMK